MNKKFFALVTLIAFLFVIPGDAIAAKKKSSSRESSSSATFDLNKFIQAHRSNDRNTIHQQLVALRGDFKRTYSVRGTGV